MSVQISPEAKRSLLLALRFEAQQKIERLIQEHQRTERELFKAYDERISLDKLLGLDAA